MPHNRFFYEKPLIGEGELILSEEESHHAVKVMRLSPSDVLEIVDGQGALVKAKMTHFDKKRVYCSIISCETHKRPLFNYILIQGLLRHTSLELVCEKMTELGAEGLWLFPAERSEKSSLSTHQLERLYRHRVSALKQCGRLLLPEIKILRSLEEAVKLSPYPLFFGDVSDTAPLIEEKLQGEAASFIVGPESGFDTKEVALMKQGGALGVTLHPLILRAETASITACSVLSSLLEKKKRGI